MTTFASTQDGVASNVTTEAKTIQVGRTRAYGIHYVGTATAGTIELKDGTTSKVKIEVSSASEKAKQAVEKIGGELNLISS